MEAEMHEKCSDYSAADDGQSSRTCSEISAGAGEGFVLFGVRVMMDVSFRKCANMNNLAQFDQQPQDSTNDVAVGYASDDVVYPSERNRNRKRGGKGDWKGISRNYVKTRTPTQVASHAQKYFLRQNNHNRRRRRSSFFDITADAIPIPCDNPSPLQNLVLNQLNNSPKPIRPIPILPPASKMADLNLNNQKSAALGPHSQSLDLSISSQSQEPPQLSYQQSPPARHVASFQAMPTGFNESGGDNIISVV
ncbi:myb-like transcription factor family protein [Striga hermonthica]|uniref:Myb-like transcription factor family protein n=1 Tax=Striga hermonthica TaxID=68872 RepID=A0A9N7NMI3_STRHE|nr:myb-like transcription factor family protein [Striga hermonthica]